MKLNELSKVLNKNDYNILIQDDENEFISESLPKVVKHLDMSKIIVLTLRNDYNDGICITVKGLKNQYHIIEKLYR